ncbi:MAG: radical SAM protein [Rhizobiaceae bacterium]
MIKFPRVVDLNVNGACNLNCFFCYGPSKDAAELKTESILRCIDILKGGGVEFISITGGEPTLRSDLLTIVAHVKSKGMQCALHTNGHFLGRNNPLLQYLSWIAMPLDGFDSKSHQRMRGDSVGFERVTTFLDWLSSSEHRPNLQIKIGTVVTRNNVNQLKRISGVLSKLDIDVWKIHELRPRGMGAVSYRKTHVDNGEIRRIVEEIQKSETGYKISYSSTSQSDGAYMFVYPDGEVRTPKVDGYVSHGCLLNPNFEFDFAKEMSVTNFNNNVELAYGIQD